MVELFKDISDDDDDAKYGITTVQPNRAIKKCKIRSLRIEYFLTEIAVVLVTPKSCVNCERMDDCTDDFTEQIIQKYYERHMNSDAYYVL